MEDNIISSMLQNPLRCTAIYARESNASAQNALDTQVKSCLECADKNKLLVYDIYKEFISSTKKSYDKRIAFMKLIHDAKRGYFKTIIVTKRDRIARNFEEYIEIRNMLKKLDIKVLYSNDIQLANNDDYALSFIDNLIMGIAEMEAATIAERTENGRRMQIAEGIYKGPLPPGLCYKNGEAAKDGVMGDVISKVFDIFLSSESIKTANQVIEELKKAAPSFGDKQNQFNKIVDSFKPGTIQTIIGNPRYAGLMISSIDYKYRNFNIRYKDEVHDVKKKHFQNCRTIKEHLVTPENWYAAVEKWTRFNKKRKTRSRKANSKINQGTSYIFKDFFYCEKCGKSIKLKGNNYICGTEKCFKKEKSIFIKLIFDRTFKELVSGDRIDKVLEDIVRKLKSDKDKSGKKLALLTSEQNRLVQMYVNDPSVSDIEHEIERKVKEQSRIRNNIEIINDKIKFLVNDCKRAVMILTETEYMNIMVNEIQKNQLVLKEFFKYEDIEKRFSNEYSIGVRGNKSRYR